MDCKKPQSTVTRINCATICTNKWNNPPIARFKFQSYSLLEDSAYFEVNPASQSRQVNWQFWCNGNLLYETGWKDEGDLFSELNNGSIYKEPYMGNANIDALAFLNTIPLIQLNSGTQIKVVKRVSDNTGIKSQTNSNEYIFHT